MKKKKLRKSSRSALFLSKKKVFILLGVVSSTMVFLYSMAQTYAALTDADQVKNDFKIGNVQAEVEEEFQPPTILEPDIDYVKKVTVKNTGEQPIFIRVLSIPVFTKKQTDGSLLLLPIKNQAGEGILTIDYNFVDWTDGNDGYFYYNQKLAEGEISRPLFERVKMNSNTITDDYIGVNLTFEIKSEAIGITKYGYRDAWWQGKTPTSTPLMTIDAHLKELTIN